MQKSFYFLSPVEVVKVTSHNLAEVAEWCGGSVQETESRRVPGRMDQYVWVPTPKGTNISWAFPGMFITKRLVISAKNELRATWAVFRRDYFDKNYFETPQDATDKTWEREAAERLAPKREEVEVTTHIKDAMAEAMARVKKAAEKAGLPETQAEAIVVDMQANVEENLSEKLFDVPAPVLTGEEAKDDFEKFHNREGVVLEAPDEDEVDDSKTEILDPDTADLDPRQEQVFSG